MPIDKREQVGEGSLYIITFTSYCASPVSCSASIFEGIPAA